MAAKDEARDRARRIRLLLLDGDGILTDGRLIIGPDGAEWKAFHSRDGLGIRLAERAGLAIGIVSGRHSAVLRLRAEELGLGEIHGGASDKLSVFREVATRRGLEAAEVGFMGDDLIDLPAMRAAGLAVTVPEAPLAVARHAHLVTATAGGKGAVREAIEFVLAAQGRWQAIVASFEAV